VTKEGFFTATNVAKVESAQIGEKEMIMHTETESLTKTTRVKAGHVELRACVRACSLGSVLVAATARGICFAALDDDPAALRAALHQRFPGSQVGPSDPALDAAADALVALIEGDRGLPFPRAAGIPLDLHGTPFQRKVWAALQEIPAGTTVTYTDIAKRIGTPRAVRAVGTACGQNPVSVAVPCHRVLRGDGSLGGYRWGLERKRALLDRERARAS
jgi:AraC family transcriptional regulator of adaptative response/methylated-DNA-[protein]-cysteine methyltransferase